MAVLNTINTFFVLSATNTGADSSAPYDFQEWKIRNTNVAPNDLIPLYNTYLKTWYLRKDISQVVSVDYVKNYYKVSNFKLSVYKSIMMLSLIEAYIFGIIKRI